MFVKTTTMKTISIATLLSLLIVLPAHAQKTVKAKEKMKLVMPGSSGTNGVGVAWNPGKKLYYACFAGNESYPLVTFSKKGAVVNSELKTDFDTRGFWFNKAENRLEGTVYGGAVETAGFFYRPLDSKGTPESGRYVKFPGVDVLSDQCAPAYDYDKDELVYRDGKYITRYSKKDGSEKGKLTLKLPEGASWNNITEFTTVYTGKKGEEFGVLDFSKGKIYLFDAFTGSVTKTIELPESAPDPETFNFSYTNKMFWVFSTLSRTWYGYSHP